MEEDAIKTVFSNSKFYMFEVPGKPQAKQRPRLGKYGVYTPTQTHNYENWIKLCFINKYGNEFKPLENAIIMYITVFTY